MGLNPTKVQRRTYCFEEGLPPKEQELVPTVVKRHIENPSNEIYILEYRLDTGKSWEHEKSRLVIIPKEQVVL